MMSMVVPGKLSKALVIMLFSFATDEKTRAEAWEGVKNGAVKMWDDFWSRSMNMQGGVAFENLLLGLSVWVK